MTQSRKEDPSASFGVISPLAAAVENAVGIIFRLDQALRFIYLNPVAESVLGVPLGKAIGRTISQCKSASELFPRLQTVAARVIKTRNEEQIELAVEGGATHYWCRIIPERAEDGSTHIIGFARDVTDHKHAIAALAESTARMRSVLLALPDMVFIIGADGTYHEYLPGIGVAPLAEPADLLGKKVTEVTHPGVPIEQNVEGMRLIEAALRTRQVQSMEFAVKIGDQTIYHEARIAPYSDDEVIAIVRDVSDQRKAESALAESDSRTRALLEALPEMAFRIARDGTYLEFVPGVGIEPAVSPTRFLGRKVREVMTADIAPGVADLIMSAIKTALETGVVQALEFRVLVQSRWGDYEARVAPSGADEVVIAVREVSDRKRAEREVAESGARTRALLEALPEMAFRISRDGMYLEFVPGIGIEPAVPPAQFLGRKVREALTEEVAPGAADRIMSAVESALETGVVQSTEYQVVQGSLLLDYEARVAPCGSDEVISAVRDITSRKQAERALAEAEARWRSLVQNLPSLVAVMDTEGRLQYVNRTVPPLTASEVAGRNGIDFIDRRYHKQFRAVMARVIEGGPAERYEIPGVGPNGVTTWYESRMAPLVADGKVTGVIVISVDISEQRRLEEALRAARDELDTRIEAAAGAGNRYSLSYRELSVLHLVSQGRSDKEIATVLGLRPRTVSKHVEKILKKMSCSSRTEAGGKAIRENLVQ